MASAGLVKHMHRCTNLHTRVDLCHTYTHAPKQNKNSSKKIIIIMQKEDNNEKQRGNLVMRSGKSNEIKRSRDSMSVFELLA